MTSDRVIRIFGETQIMKAFAFTVFLYMIFSLEIKILNLLWCAPRQDKEKVGQKVVSSWEGVRDRGQSRGCRKCSSPGVGSGETAIFGAFCGLFGVPGNFR